MATIKIMDPVTRIEGHMKVEVSIDQVNGVQKIIDAKCTGTLFRGFEALLRGRNPFDATVLTQRICGVCPISHSLTATLAQESIGGWYAKKNARLLRNLTLGANFLMSHILHFYLLAAADYASGPAASPWTPSWSVDLRAGGQGIMAHLPQALEARRRAHEMGAIFGGRMPSAHSYIPGGFTARTSAEKIAEYRGHLAYLLSFIESVYLDDVLALADVYPDYFEVGAGPKNLLAFGVFDTSDTARNRLLSPGYAEAGSTTVQKTVPIASITEQVKYAWYSDSNDKRNPASGATTPSYPKGAAYSWLKAPRMSGKPFETGALARMWINGDYRQGISVMDRHVARAQEARKIAVAMQGWLNELDPAGASFDTAYTQRNGSGVGLAEAPRGALGHWIKITDRKIAHYQIITPTCWNCSPRDSSNVPGPVEQALIGTKIQDAERPIEALRVIHSFDPCLSCAVHVMRADGTPVVVHTNTRGNAAVNG